MEKREYLTEKVRSSRFEHRMIAMIQVILGNGFLLLMSQLAIPLPLTSVPFTLQTLGIFILAGVLGKRKASYSVILYLVEGCCGLPVFAGIKSNPLWLLSPQAGFLLSFVLTSYVIGKLLEKQKYPVASQIFLVLILGQILISSIGMLGLSFFVGLQRALLMGVIPFLAGALIKVTVGTGILKTYFILRRKYSEHTSS